MGRKLIDFRVVGLALLIAVLLWFHVVTEKEYVQELEVPLKIENEPEDLVLLTMPPRTVHLKVRGNGKELLKYNLDREHRFCRLDISNGIRGEVLYTLGEENVGLAYGLHLVDISNGQLKFRFDRRATKSVGVRVNTTGAPKEGYTVVRKRAVPEEVSLSGPESLIRNTDFVENEPVKIDDRNKPFQSRTKLMAPEGRGWVFSPESVLVEISIEKLLASTYDSVPVIVVNKPGGRRISVTPDFIKLILSGAESSMREMDVARITVEIELEGLSKGEYSLPARIKLPEGVNLISAVPKRFKVVIE
ncbi:hypothetical protein AMJ40_02245 [candidate division TA06 bacterium DG_26]|uniref:YbbR-like domain-containing protein n=1 Tax=candidate division TA06 bacterium DG_26 TaxID=1703771 RepID=A0A0S7WKI6_UNCT6|nr:MAG: hypothetical protein AMJ40_02245 [candidate division TA06 bacterium DG_26]